MIAAGPCFGDERPPSAANEQSGPLRFQEQLIRDGYGYAYGIATADLDGDGDLDRTSSDTVADKLLWFENDGPGKFTERLIWFERHAIGDIDGDKRLDISVVKNLHGDVLWFHNSGPPRDGNPWEHMHVRGKDFRYTAHYPDGRSEILLNVPNYDFNWQHRFRFAETLLIPKGTTIECVAHFDSSADNPANPDPTKTVRPDLGRDDDRLVFPRGCSDSVIQKATETCPPIR